MKKTLFALLGLAFLCASCEENPIKQLDQNPYRTIQEYTPHTFTMEVPGTLTPVEDYDWITVSTSGNTATFDVRRNTSGHIRCAEFAISGSSYPAIVNQEKHTLDASTSAEFLSQASGSATLSCIIGSSFQDDYTGEWGYVYSKSTDPEEGVDVALTSKFNWGYNECKITGLQDGTDYFAWTYVKSTEGDKVFSNMVAILPPVYVRAGDDLQAAINSAKPYGTVMLQGGVEFLTPAGGIQLGGNNVNKTISGGWDADFKTQSMDNLTKINGNGNRGFNCANSDDTPISGYSKLSYLDIYGCFGNYGSAIHAVGGPVTVSNCYVHDNKQDQYGAIGTNSGSFATDLTVVNCIVKNNSANGHGGAFGICEGKSFSEPTVVTIVSCLIIDNVSTKKDGYCSTFDAKENTELIFVNNTMVGNKNWNEYGGPWAGTTCREHSRPVFANNIIIGNLVSPCTEESDIPVYERGTYNINFKGASASFVNNVYEGKIWDDYRMVGTGTIALPIGGDLKNFLVDPESGNYNPAGSAICGGTLSSIQYKAIKDAGNKVLDVKALLEKYNKDLAGNPRTANGKVDCGCYQIQ